MNWKIAVLLGIFGILYCVFIGIGIKKSGDCDEHIVLIDGTEYDCIDVSSYKEGTTHIKTCDGKKIIVPTIRVKEITRK